MDQGIVKDNYYFLNLARSCLINRLSIKSCVLLVRSCIVLTNLSNRSTLPVRVFTYCLSDSFSLGREKANAVVGLLLFLLVRGNIPPFLRFCVNLFDFIFYYISI